MLVKAEILVELTAKGMAGVVVHKRRFFAMPMVEAREETPSKVMVEITVEA